MRVIIVGILASDDETELCHSTCVSCATSPARDTWLERGSPPGRPRGVGEHGNLFDAERDRLGGFADRASPLSAQVGRNVTGGASRSRLRRRLTSSEASGTTIVPPVVSDISVATAHMIARPVDVITRHALV